MANKTYISPQQAYHDINMGDAGVAKINLKTGLASAVIPLVSMPGNNMPLNLELVFNGGQINDFYMGYGFKLGCMQKLVYNSTDESLTYTDAGMNERLFTKQENNDDIFWADTTGSGLTITGGYDNYVIHYPNDIKYNFSSEKLRTVTNRYGKKTTFTYSNNKLSQITDAAGRIAKLNYGSNGNVANITIGDYVVTFNYIDNKLTTLSIPGKGVISFTYSQGSVPVPGVAAYQNIAYYLTSVVNPCGQEYTFALNADKVVQEVDMYSHHKTIPANASENITDLMDKHTFQYVNDYTTWITNNKGITYTYSMDETGALVSCWEGVEDNFCGDIQYISSGKNTVKLNTAIPYSSTWANVSYNVGTYSTDTLIKSFTSTEINNVREKMIVVSSFLKVLSTSGTTPFGALSIKIGTNDGSEEWFNAIYEPGNDSWQFTATAAYVPYNCTAIEIHAKCTNITTRFTKLRVQTPNTTASQPIVYLCDSSENLIDVFPVSKINRVQYLYEYKERIHGGVYRTVTKTEFSDIKKLYGIDIARMLSQTGAYKVLTFFGGKIWRAGVKEIYLELLDGNKYQLFTTDTIYGNISYSQQGMRYTETAGYYADPITKQISGPYIIYEGSQPVSIFGQNRSISNYNSYGQLTKHTSVEGIVTEYTYDSYGNCTKVKTYDKNDASKYFEQSYEYIDSGDKLFKEYDTQGYNVQNYYDTIGHADAFVDANGNRTEYCVTPNDMMLKCMCMNMPNNSLIHTHYGYNNGLLTNVTNNTGGFTFTYSGDGSINKVEIDGIRDSGETNYKPLLIASKTHTTGDDTATVEFANGYIAKTVLDKYGRVKETFDNNVSKTTNTYVNNKLDTHIDNYTDTTVKYTYDSCGELQQVTETTTGNTLVSQVKTTKNADNLPYTKEVTFADNSVVKNTYSYNNNKLNPRLVGEAIALNGVQKASLSYNYDNFGRLLSKNSLQNVSYVYNTLSDGSRLTNQVKRVTYHDGSYDEYTYDKNGNIIQVTSSTGDTIKYVYDSLNRLTEEVNCMLKQRTLFTYDTSGNITQKRIIKCEEQSDATINYAYTNSWKDQLSHINGQRVLYDTFGNPTSYKDNTLYWTRGRMLERFGDKACYTYNSAGIRTEKCIDGVPTKYVVSGDTILSETTNGVTTIYYHSADGIIGFNRDGTDYFYRKNLQGDIIAIVNASGGVVAKYVYDAWGNHKAFNATGSVIYDSTNPTAYSSYTNHVGYLNPFRYRGYYFDNETGLYYLNSRYYDPQVGRFINADTINYLNPKNFNGLNLYSYCLNNPVMLSDPMGTSVDWEKVFGWIIVGIGVVALSVITAGSFVWALTPVLSSTLTGLGIGGITAMAISIARQGGFSNSNPYQVFSSMVLGSITGAIGGTIGYATSSVAKTIGFEIGTNIAKVIGSSIISSTSTMLLTTASSAIAGAVAGTASNILLNRAFDGLDGEHETLGETITGAVQSDAISWFMDLLKWLFV